MSKLEEAIERLKQIIKDNNEIIKEAQEVNSTHLVAGLANDTSAIETVLEELNNSIPKQYIQEKIEVLPELTSHINYDTYSIENNRHKINELVRAVNKMRKTKKEE